MRLMGLESGPSLCSYVVEVRSYIGSLDPRDDALLALEDAEMSKVSELKRQDRSTRAKRYLAALNDELEKDEADQSFWNQEFFQGKIHAVMEKEVVWIDEQHYDR